MFLAAESAAAASAPHWVWTWPFVVILLCIAILPLFKRTAHWWHDNRNKLLISVVVAVVALAYYWLRGFGVAHDDHVTSPGWETVLHILRHALLDEYLPFLTLLFALFVICGGIVVTGDVRATPWVNTLILALGGLLASLIGTTGASMVLIRFLLQTNSERRRVVHTVVFFIFIVSNIGGSLLPIGDPPLFLGYLRGVPFLWTLRLAAPWAVCLIVLLAVHHLWDRYAYARETPSDIRRDVTLIQRPRVRGLQNLVWLLIVVLGVAVLVPGRMLPGTAFVVPPYLREAVLLFATGLAWITTPSAARVENRFEFTPIGEVAALFLGIFIAMQIPIEILHQQGPALAASGFTEPWKFFWATGLLSSFLDNAPTYVVFFEIANQFTTANGPETVRLATGDFIRNDQLLAISCGAVFMGAMTYIGNGPNFMVKSIAEQAGVRMPSFFGFAFYSACVLLPLFAVLTVLFFL